VNSFSVGQASSRMVYY